MDDQNRVVKDVQKATHGIETEYDNKTQKLIYERWFTFDDKTVSINDHKPAKRRSQ
jgi:hypothetical protein